MHDAPISAKIRLTNDEDLHEVPADILMRVLAGMQQLIYVIATAQEHKPIKTRFRVSQEIQQRYSLSCQIPQPGSYVMPMTLGTTKSNSSVFTDYKKLMDTTEAVWREIQQGKLARLSEILPDSKLRNRVLREIRKMLPKSGEGWKLGFQQRDNPEILVSADSAIAIIDQELTQDSSEDMVMTVTGELIRIDFDRHTVVLRYPPTHTEIECIYVEEVEETMIENRRELVQATGKFTLDQEGHPISLSDVTRLQPVDLSPMTLKSVKWGDRIFRFTEPMVLQPSLDEESQQLYVVEEPSLTLYAYAQTREQLLLEISEQIAFMWDEYVQAEDQDLAADALDLKQSLVKICQELSQNDA